jgi:hypothetical protein
VLPSHATQHERIEVVFRIAPQMYVEIVAFNPTHFLLTAPPFGAVDVG